MKFTKMHGCGNDYIYVNGFEERVEEAGKPELARRLSHRQHGIGADGLIFINPSSAADFEMEMYNADGTRAQMCGNGIRCVGKYVYDKGMADGPYITVESGGQIKHLELLLRGVKAERAEPSGEEEERSGQRGAETECKELSDVDREHGKPAGIEAEHVERYERGKEVMYVRVNMGSPILTPSLIPVEAEGNQAVNVPINATDREINIK